MGESKIVLVITFNKTDGYVKIDMASYYEELSKRYCVITDNYEELNIYLNLSTPSEKKICFVT
jgi:hypothetical protein